MTRKDAMMVRDDECNNVSSKMRSKRKYKKGEFEFNNFQKGSDMRKCWTRVIKVFSDEFKFESLPEPFYNTATVKKDFIPKEDERYDKWKTVLKERPLDFHQRYVGRVTFRYFVEG